MLPHSSGATSAMDCVKVQRWPGEILERVLPFAERIAGRRPQDPRPVIRGPLAMTIDVVDTDHHRVREIDPLDSARGRPDARRFRFVSTLLGDDDRAVADVELDAMVRDAHPHTEAEGRATAAAPAGG